MQVETLDHIHIYSAHPEESALFYRERFNAIEIVRNENIHKQTRIFLALAGQVVVIGLFPPDIEPARPDAAGDGAYRHGFGVAHFGLRVADVVAPTEELREAGVKILGEPVLEPGGLSYSYIEAPDGVVLELTQYA